MRTLLSFLGVGFIGLSFITGLVVSRVRGGLQSFIKPNLVYLLLYGAAFAVTGLLGGLHFFDSATQYFLFFQFIFLGLGILHVYTMYKYLKWINEKTFWAEILFTFIVALLGALFFIMTYRIFRRDGMSLISATSAFAFIVPLFVYFTYKAAVSIPFKILKQWFYPLKMESAMPDEKKLRNLLVISFEFLKKTDDKHYTNFRAKAPVDMEFGELFYYFINDYNDRHQHSTISYLSGGGEPAGWVFFKKPKWYTFSTKYIDADKTVFINKIKENDIIICSRVS